MRSILLRLMLPSMLCSFHVAPLLALETAERALAVEATPAADGFVEIENLLGSVRLVAAIDADPGEVRIEARAVAEAGTAEEAQALVDAIRLARRGAGIFVEYPLDRTGSFRPPKAGMKGAVSRWTATVLRRKGATFDYDGRTVEIGSGRQATGLAVHLVVHVPFDSKISVTQAAGKIQGQAIRADLRLRTIAGDVTVDRSFGALDVVTKDGEVEITSFQGERLAVVTDSGDVEVLEVRVGAASLTTGEGKIRGGGITAGELFLESVSGTVELREVEPETFAARTDSGKIDLAMKLKRTREANIRSASGDVTLRVGALSNFDLVAKTPSGQVKTVGLDLDLVEQDGPTSRLRYRSGGRDVQVDASSVVLRIHEESKRGPILGDKRR